MGTISKTAFIAAVNEVSPKVAANVATIANRKGVTGELTWEEAGVWLCAALVGHAEGVEEVPGGLFLSSVHWVAPGREGSLTPDEARAHQLTREWVAETAGEAFGVILTAYATGADLAPGVSAFPVIDVIELIEVPGADSSAYCASIAAHFPESAAGEITLRMTFGAEVSESAALVESRSMTGGGFAHIASFARALTEALADSPEAAADAVAAITDEAASPPPSVH